MKICCFCQTVWQFSRSLLLALIRIDSPRGFYRNDPMFSDIYSWANSADPDQTAPRSGSTLFAIPSASFGLISLW